MNNQGGYTFFFGKGFQNTDPDWENRRRLFKSALTKWRCATLVNIGVNEGTGVIGAVGNCLVEIDTIFSPTGTASTTRAVTSLQDIICGDDQIAKHFQLWRAEIYINHFTPNNLVTFEATMLHELGHVHLLNHTCNNPMNVMTIANMFSPLDLATDDILGGVHETRLGSSTSDPECLKPSPMDSINVGDCVVPVIEVEGIKYLAKIYPNPSRGEITIEFDSPMPIEGKIKLLNSLGIEVASAKGRLSSRNKIDVSKLSPGIYFVSIKPESGKTIFIGKIQKL